MESPDPEPIPFNPADHPRKLNLGCGFDIREGYLNVDLNDFHDPDLVADILALDMLPSASYDEIVAIDILEHVERDDVPKALDEWARLLRDGGKLVLQVPDILGIARMLARDHAMDNQANMLLCLFGTQAYNGDYHLAGFTEVSFRTQLHAAGFEVESLRQRHHWMFDCVAIRRTEIGPLELGPLPLMRLCDDKAHQLGRREHLGPVDGTIAAIADHVPDGPRELARKVWRPTRRRLVKLGVLD